MLRAHFILLALTFSSCIQQDDSFHSDAEEVLDVEAVFSPGHQWEAFIGHTSNDLNVTFEDLIVEDAIVIVRDFSEFRDINLEYIGNGLYASKGFIPVEGETYEIEVSAPGFKDVIADSYVPSIANIDSTDVHVVFDESRGGYVVEIDLASSSQEENYFFFEHYFEEVITYEETVETLGVDPNGEDFDLEPYIPKYDEENFNWVQSEDISSDGIITDFIPGEETSTPSPINTLQLVIHVGATSEQLFDFWSTKGNQSDHYSSLVAANSKFSNVSNGVGVFGGYNQKTFRF